MGVMSDNKCIPSKCQYLSNAMPHECLEGMPRTVASKTFLILPKFETIFNIKVLGKAC
jgi:hypothetical protein